MTGEYDPRTGRQRGMTLIEVMIVVAILGIIAAIAVPAYNSYLLVARRSDARSALNQIAAQQAEYVLNHSAYASTVTSLGIATVSENSFYNLAIVSNSGAATFRARATATGVQTRDKRCATFDINDAGTKTSKTSGGAASTGDCW